MPVKLNGQVERSRLKPVREAGKHRRRRSGINHTPLRKNIGVRTFSDWNDPPPGFFKMDMVAHCGTTVAGSHVHSLVLTGIASGWTEGAAMIVREQTLITLTVEEIRKKLSFPMLGLDVDNDRAFINSTVVDYCQDKEIKLTRSRAYKKNDQAWIEQKKRSGGSADGRVWTSGRCGGDGSVGAIARGGAFYVNFFQPSFKLESKSRNSAKVSKKYDPPATPYERLLANDRVTDESKGQLRQVFSGSSIRAGSRARTRSSSRARWRNLRWRIWWPAG